MKKGSKTKKILVMALVFAMVTIVFASTGNASPPPPPPDYGNVPHVEGKDASRTTLPEDIFLLHCGGPPPPYVEYVEYISIGDVTTAPLMPAGYIGLDTNGDGVEDFIHVFYDIDSDESALLYCAKVDGLPVKIDYTVRYIWQPWTSWTSTWYLDSVTIL